MVLPRAPARTQMSRTGATVLYVGDDWAEDQHDVEVMDEAGKVLAKRRLAGGVAGIAQLHELIGRHLGEDADAAEVVIGIETDHGPWVTGAAARLRWGRLAVVVGLVLGHHDAQVALTEDQHPVGDLGPCGEHAVIHCSSQEQAVMVRDALAARLAEVGLELHPDKTRVVYCKDADRRGDHEVTSFTFLGYTFRPRLAKNRRGKHFVSFLPAVSKDAVKAMSREIRSWHIARRSDKSLTDLAQMFNSIVQGWINYYGRFYKSMLYPLLRRINDHLVRWACRKYKRLRRREKRAKEFLARVARRFPPCSLTGASASNPTAGRWEPCKPRGFRTVLRAAGGEIPPADSPGRDVLVPQPGRAGAGAPDQPAGQSGPGTQGGQDPDSAPGSRRWRF